jgi:hypothetical protein
MTPGLLLQAPSQWGQALQARGLAHWVRFQEAVVVAALVEALGQVAPAAVPMVQRPQAPEPLAAVCWPVSWMDLASPL